MTDYADFSIRDYWLLDPALGSLEVFGRGADGRYSRALAATSGRVSAIPGCDALELDLDDLWRQPARLGPDTE